MKKTFKTIGIVSLCVVAWLLHWGIGFVVSSVILLLEARKIRRKRMAERFKEIYGLPLPDGWGITNHNTAKKVEKYIREYPQYSGIDLYNLKLQAFYDISMSLECSDPAVYVPYREQLDSSLRNLNLLRMDNDEQDILSGGVLEIDTIIADGQKRLKAKTLGRFNKKLKELVDIDTTNFLGFTSTRKMTEQTREMQHLVINAQREYEELRSFVPPMNRLLATVRLAAYRNIYLSMELLGFIRDNVGGKTLTTQKDTLKLEGMELKSANLDATDLSLDSLEALTNGATMALDMISSNKDIRKWAGENPKTAAAGTAVMAGLNYLAERSVAIENNKLAQADIVKDFGKISSMYTESKAGLLRSLEIAKAIVNANKGFVRIYAPLREKVFGQRNVTLVSMDELRQLVEATNAYNKITKSKIK